MFRKLIDPIRVRLFVQMAGASLPRRCRAEHKAIGCRREQIQEVIRRVLRQMLRDLDGAHDVVKAWCGKGIALKVNARYRYTASSASLKAFRREFQTEDLAAAIAKRFEQMSAAASDIKHRVRCEIPHDAVRHRASGETGMRFYNVSEEIRIVQRIERCRGVIWLAASL